MEPVNLRIIFTIFALVLLSACDKQEKKPIDSEVRNEHITISAEPKGHAWWLRTRFNPLYTEIRGIPVSKIDRSWRTAAELRKQYIPAQFLVKNGVDIMSENNSSFNLESDFNKDGTKDLAVVGVYKTINNQKGNFLLILSESDGGNWKKSYLYSWPKETGYLAIGINSNDKLKIWFCMYCNHGTSFSWSRTKKQYAQNPQPKMHD